MPVHALANPSYVQSNQVTTKSITSNHRPQPLHRLNNLLALVLRHPFLHRLRRALDKFLAIHQTQPQHLLYFLYDLGLGAGVEGF